MFLFSVFGCLSRVQTYWFGELLVMFALIIVDLTMKDLSLILYVLGFWFSLGLTIGFGREYFSIFFGGFWLWQFLAVGRILIKKVCLEASKKDVWEISMVFDVFFMFALQS